MEDIRDATPNLGLSHILRAIKALVILYGKINDFISNKKVLYDRKTPFLRISTAGKKYIFETNAGPQVFANEQELKKNLQLWSLFQVYSINGGKER